MAMQLNPTFFVDMYRISYDERMPMDVRRVWGGASLREGYSFAHDDDRSMSWQFAHWWAE